MLIFSLYNHPDCPSEFSKINITVLQTFRRISLLTIDKCKKFQKFKHSLLVNIYWLSFIIVRTSGFSLSTLACIV